MKLEDVKQWGQRWGMWILIPILAVAAFGAGAFNPWGSALARLAGGVPSDETRVVVITARDTKRDERTKRTSDRQVTTRRRVVETLDGGATRTTDEWISDLTRDSTFAHLQLDEKIEVKSEKITAPALERYRVGLLGGAGWSPPGAVVPLVSAAGGVRLGNTPLWLDGAVIVSPSATPSAAGLVGLSLTFK